MSSISTTGDHGINGNLNVSNSLTSSGLTISSGNVNFTGATFTSNCIPSAAVSGGGGGSSSSNASTITVANDASLTITSGYIPYCGVTNNNVALKTNGGLKYNAMTGTLTTTLNGKASSASTSTTQASGDNSTNIATTEFVQNAIYPITDITYTPYTNNIYTNVGHNFSIGGNLSVPINSGAFIYTYDGSNYQSTAFNLIPKLSFLSDMSGSTIQTQLNNLSSSLSNYLTTSNANSTYATISSLSNYLTTAAASSNYATIASLSNYLTTATAASTYAPISSLSSYLTTATASSTYATIASPTFTGTPKSITPITSDNSTNIATTAYVQSNLGSLTAAQVGLTTNSFSSNQYLVFSPNSSGNVALRANTNVTVNPSTGLITCGGLATSGNLTLPSTFTTPSTGQLGYTISTNPTGTSVTDGNKTIATLTLDVGVWIINGVMQTVVTGNFGLYISLTTNALDGYGLQLPASGVSVYNVSRIYTNTTASKSVYLVVSTGSTITPSNIYFTAVKIA